MIIFHSDRPVISFETIHFKALMLENETETKSKFTHTFNI